ncbi:MAG: preprotein translocase subunit SecA [Spirochaetes bacterium]|nr:preprotein translocase subunit SecA [Spirochaetota bacterium]
MPFLEKIFGSQNERNLKKIYPLIDTINSFEQKIKNMTDSQLKDKKDEFKNRLKNGKTLDDILPEAFACVREAAWRTLGQRHFDVQMIGAIALHRGMIAEMKTGEGKTLAATASVYLNALMGEGVHVVTVNDYLAKRDAEWMGPIYKLLGMSVGVILECLDNEQRKTAYGADITYGTNNQFGFDYLRDNMVFDINHKVQRGFHYCIVDEIDSILIDEARTPLIISGSAENDTKKILNVKKIVPYFKEVEKNPDGRYPDEADPFNPQKPVGDFKLDEKSKSVSFTDDGMTKAEDLMQKRNFIHGSLFNQENFEYMHYLTQAMKAEYLFRNEVDYIVKNNEVMIVDEHTGRILEGRRYSDGLHQAIEAKENITVQRRSKTYASITFQNFFRMYKKLSGMTGTADTEAAEFKNIYNLDVLVIPTNVPVTRRDNSDRVYISFNEKAKAVVNEIKEVHIKGQPILIGTISVEKSEYFSNLLRKNNIRHNVLNAKNHLREAEIIAEAGRVGAVTIATNMAGRGTDIKLGGERQYDELFEELIQNADFSENDKGIYLELKKLLDKMQFEEAEKLLSNLSPEAKKGAIQLIESANNWKDEHESVIELGGLFVLGSERHESRRIDNQLRGRSGRQGDPGGTRFYVSLEDDLMRLFGGERIQRMLTGFGVKEDELIEHPWITNAIEKAQKRVETRNFEIRKRLLEFDDVLNLQRKSIYENRDGILLDEKIIDRVKNTAGEIFDDIYDEYMGSLKGSNEIAFGMLVKEFKDVFFIDINTQQIRNIKNPSDLYDLLKKTLMDDLENKNKVIMNLNELLRNLYLSLIDRYWQDHLENMEQLRDSVYLRTYSQKNPLVEYKIEGANMFENLIDKIRSDVINQIFKIKIETISVAEREEALAYNHSGYSSFEGRQVQSAAAQNFNRQNQNISQGGQTTVMVKSEKIGRNDPCPCGSGKKYKKCCGA